MNGQPRLPLNLSISRRIIDDTVSVLLASDIKLAEGLKQDLESLDLNIGYKVTLIPLLTKFDDCTDQVYDSTDS